MRLNNILAVLGTVLAAGLAACQVHSGSVSARQQPQPLNAVQRDQALAEKVKRSLVGVDSDPYGIEVVAHDGAVGLYGSAYNEHERRRLEITAAGVVGVRSVQNHIVIDPGV